MGLLIGYSILYLAEYSTSIYPDVYVVRDQSRNIPLNIFVFSECMIFCLYIRQQMKRDAGKRMMLFFLQVFPIIVAFIWLYNDSILYYPTAIVLIRSFIVIISALFYYYDVITDPPDLLLKEHPPFLIINGMLLHAAFSIPLSLCIDDTCNSCFVHYSVKYLPYLILFTSFNLALKCQTRKIHLSPLQF
jgi:hypothetical protein